ncbi:MAG: hypothetical protein SGJ04_06210 [Bacteroidota bacterium]|nr:hypothetical protein [Bacteroidota bacterium]
MFICVLLLGKHAYGQISILEFNNASDLIVQADLNVKSNNLELALEKYSGAQSALKSLAYNQKSPIYFIARYQYLRTLEGQASIYFKKSSAKSIYELLRFDEDLVKNYKTLVNLGQGQTIIVDAKPYHLSVVSDTFIQQQTRIKLLAMYQWANSELKNNKFRPLLHSDIANEWQTLFYLCQLPDSLSNKDFSMFKLALAKSQNINGVEISLELRLIIVSKFTNYLAQSYLLLSSANSGCDIIELATEWQYSGMTLPFKADKTVAAFTQNVNTNCITQRSLSALALAYGAKGDLAKLDSLQKKLYKTYPEANSKTYASFNSAYTQLDDRTGKMVFSQKIKSALQSESKYWMIGVNPFGFFINQAGFSIQHNKGKSANQLRFILAVNSIKPLRDAEGIYNVYKYSGIQLSYLHRNIIRQSSNGSFTYFAPELRYAYRKMHITEAPIVDKNLATGGLIISNVNPISNQASAAFILGKVSSLGSKFYVDVYAGLGLGYRSLNTGINTDQWLIKSPLLDKDKWNKFSLMPRLGLELNYRL